jgi:xanthine dehydrogenase YagT iron-sulfur-binding subunit
MPGDTRSRRASFTRRGFLKGLGSVSAAVTASGLPLPRWTEGAEEVEVPPALRSSVVLRVNGERHTLELPNRATLLDTLRDNLGLTGTKMGCDQGHCGACTVLVDGLAVYSCSQLAVLTDGRDIRTIEGLERDGRLDPVQEAFIAADAMQCGYCIPGQIMSARALLDRNPHPVDGEVREALCGNLCRCGAYMNFLKALVGGVKTGGGTSGG